MGDQSVEFTNGKGDLFSATIITVAHPKKSQVQPHLSTLVKILQIIKLSIAMVLPKSMDRFEWFIEKATEIGIARIIPLTSRFSERKNLNHQRAERILDSAFKQSLHLYRPILDEVNTTFSTF